MKGPPFCQYLLLYTIYNLSVTKYSLKIRWVIPPWQAESIDLLANILIPCCLFGKGTDKITEELQRPESEAGALSKNRLDMFYADGGSHWPMSRRVTVGTDAWT